MFGISDNVLCITRGNSMTIIITPMTADTGKPVILGEGDTVLFTVKNLLGTTVIQKTLTMANYDEGENLVCEVDASETINLPNGEYKYDCLMVLSDGQASTFISSKMFVTDAVGLYTDITGGDGNE